MNATATADLSLGGVSAISLANGGSGYTMAPTVNIVPAAGDTTGTGATATATHRQTVS